MKFAILFIVLLFAHGLTSAHGFAPIEENYVILDTRIEKTTFYADGKEGILSTNQKLRLVCGKPTILSGLRQESIETDHSGISKKESDESSFRVTAICLPNQMVRLSFEADQSKSEIILKINGDKGVLTVNEILQANDPAQSDKISLKINAQLTK